MHQTLSENDQAMIGLLRSNSEMTIGQLVDHMGVTATAVRQRLTKLMAMGLVDRSHSVEGRGRPSHHYKLTDAGRRSLANNLGDLAVVLWQEVQKIGDPGTRHQVISGVVERLADQYEGKIQGQTLESRMESITQLFADRQIPVALEREDGLPIIKVSGCPYPTLASENREICDMEKELLAKVLGHPLDRCSCQQDGDQCCSFQAHQSSVTMEEQPAT
jgi:predicted ArsR family transcriptional regulator